MNPAARPASQRQRSGFGAVESRLREGRHGACEAGRAGRGRRRSASRGRRAAGPRAWVGRWRCRKRRAATCSTSPPLPAKAPGEQGRGQRVEVGVARERQVQVLEPSRRREQERRARRCRGWWRRRSAPEGRRPAPVACSSSGPTSAHRRAARARRRTRPPDARLSRGQRAPARVARAPSSARPSARGRRRPRAKPPRACARSAERSRSAATVLVGHDGGLGPVPGATIRVGPGIGRLGERAVDARVRSSAAAAR